MSSQIAFKDQQHCAVDHPTSDLKGDRRHRRHTQTQDNAVELEEILGHSEMGDLPGNRIKVSKTLEQNDDRV